MSRHHLHESLYLPLVNQVMPDALFVHDEVGRILEVNAKACESLGYSAAELLRLGVVDIELDFDQASAEAMWRQMVSGKTETVYGRHRRKDGSEFPVEVHVALLPLPDLRLFLSVVRDITERKLFEERTRLQAMVFDNVEEGIVITDAEGRVVDANPAFERITEYSRAELLGKNLRILNSGQHEPEFYLAIWEALRQQGAWSGEIWNRRKSGDVYLQWESIGAVRDVRGEISNYVGVAIDLSRMRHAQSDLERMAHHDPLTDLPNRLLLVSRLEHAIERAKRFGSIGAVLFMDLDFFKEVNDRCGHASGDELLQMVAKRIKSRLREVDTLARLGGDEFVAVLVDLKSRETAEMIACDLIEQLARPFTLSCGSTVCIGVSVGIALFPSDGENAGELVKLADQALYRAKREGRGRHRFTSN
ncbi:MAG TPA: sensor domain-containing diguanylate cyclase [Rhodocyclaceae bacterium]|nr:sensor domain-containing diguanylate cyclase [Rhodocyclaceae bacterium]